MSRLASGSLAVLPMGAIVDLSGRPRYVHWHFFQMSVPNLVAIVLMLIVFALAIAIPFPKRGAGS
jgi:hypothetical protein